MTACHLTSSMVPIGYVSFRIRDMWTPEAVLVLKLAVDIAQEGQSTLTRQ